MVTWVGMDDNSPLSASDSYISKNIWADTVEDILIDTEEHWYETPENVVGVVFPLKYNYNSYLTLNL